ncbi:hypothetical protein FRB96_004329 [Tulasnella sp. 330]|nr:hypothetical protein FRB96_004329 [Tulasnella sp. 330]
MQLAYVVMFSAYLAVGMTTSILPRQAVFPDCLTQPSAYGTCLETDTACLCDNRVYVLAVIACGKTACTAASDQLQAAEAASSTCAIYGVNLSTVTAGATGATATTSISATTAYALTNVGPEATTSYNPYLPPVPTANSSATQTSSSGATVGGAVGGVGFLVIVLVLVLLRRRRRRNQIIQNLATTQGPYYGAPQGGVGGGMMMKEIKTPHSGTPGMGPNTFVSYGYQISPVQQQQQQYQREVNQQNVHPPQSPMTTASPPPGAFTATSPEPNIPTSHPSYPPMTTAASPPPPVAFPTPSPGGMPVPFQQQPSTPSSNQDPALAAGVSGLSAQQLDMMQRMQRLSPQQLELIERMDEAIRTGEGGSTVAVGGEAPPTYDFKA